MGQGCAFVPYTGNVWTDRTEEKSNVSATEGEYGTIQGQN